MLLKDKLFEQSEVYRALKRGDSSSVDYRGYRDRQWGTKDANYLNRKRLTYYLLYGHIDDEEAVAYLFREELKDRKSNSFRGIGGTLNVLTSLLRKYNGEGRYDGLLSRAKNANFDCACGYDKNYRIDDDLQSLNLLDCIYLCQDLEYRDVMELLVDQWKKGDANPETLAKFNSFLGKEEENEDIYKQLLDRAVSFGRAADIVAAYNRVIRYYIHSRQFETASAYLQKMINTIDFKDIERTGLFKKVLEECFEIIIGGGENSTRMWQWAKPRLREVKNFHGNLYRKAIAAAEAVKDPCAREIQREYINWQKKMGIN